jgi:hypothetical protein
LKDNRDRLALYRMKILLISVLVSLALTSEVAAQSRSERREQRIAESEKPQAVAGGELVSVPKNYDAAYEAALNYLKKEGRTIESASKETGQIITAIEVKGSWRQTGTRAIVTLIRERDDLTTIRAIVTQQKRFKALQVEPWSDPVVDAPASTTLAQKLTASLMGAK